METLLCITGDVTLHTAAGRLGTLPSPKAQLVLAKLVTDRSAHGTAHDVLAELIWPGGLPPTWSSALRSTLTRVRRFLEPAGHCRIESKNGRYTLELDRRITVDIDQAYDLASTKDASDADIRLALETARRPFLPFDSSLWAQGVREQLDDLRMDFLATCAVREATRQNDHEAIMLAREAVEFAPLREQAHRTMMRVHWILGNRAESIRVYNGLQTRLSEELGTAPSEATTQLYLELLGESSSDQSSSQRQDLPLVGRRRQLRQLDDLWARARQGISQLAVLTGELGIGKTRMLQTFVRRTHAPDDIVVWCHGSNASEEHPGLSTSLSLIQNIDHRTHADPAVPSVTRIAALTHALNLLLSTGQKILLLIDDADRLDPVSQHALHNTLVEIGATFNLMIVATVDPSRTVSDSRHWQALSHLLPTTTIPLPRLQLPHLNDLANFSGVQIDLGHLLASSGGNPLLAQYLFQSSSGISHTVAESVDAIHAYVRQRTDQLSPPALELLQLAAAHGEPFSAEAVRETSHVDPTTAKSAWNSLNRAELVETVAGPVSNTDERLLIFSHGAIRDSLSRGLTSRQLSRTPYYPAAPRLVCSPNSQPVDDEVDVHLGTAEELRREARSRDAVVLLERLLSAATTRPIDRARIQERLGALLAPVDQDQARKHLENAMYTAAVHTQFDTAVAAATGLLDLTSTPDSETVARFAISLYQRAESMDNECLGPLLARACRVENVVVPGKLVTAGIAQLRQRSERLTSPRDAEDRLVVADALYDLATWAGDWHASLRAAHLGLCASSILGCADNHARFGRRLEAVGSGGYVSVALRKRRLYARQVADAGENGLPDSTPDNRQVLVHEWLHNQHHQASMIEQILANQYTELDKSSLALACLIRRNRPEAQHWLKFALREIDSTNNADYKRMHDLGVLSIVAVELADAESLAQLRTALTPWRYFMCSDGYGTFAGPASYHLGMIDLALGDLTSAERRLSQALYAVAQMGDHEVWIAHIQDQLATVLVKLQQPQVADRLRAEARELRASVAVDS